MELDLSPLDQEIEEPRAKAKRRITETVANRADLRTPWLREEAGKEATRCAQGCYLKIDAGRLADLESSDPAVNPLVLLADNLSKLPAGEPRAPDPAAQVARSRHVLAKFLYSGIEIEALQRNLQPGEQIESIGWYAIKTDRKTYAREYLRSYSQPANWARDDTWNRQFSSAAAIEAAAAEAAMIAEKENREN